MKTHILAAAAIAGFLALSSAAFAQSTDTAPAMTLAQSSTSDKCVPAKDPPQPLALRVATTQIAPTVPPGNVAGAALRGSCVGTPEFVRNSQPFLAREPFQGSWFVFRSTSSAPPPSYATI